MYLYTAKFSRRRSERGTDVSERPNTRVFAVVLSHSRIYLSGRGGGGVFQGKGPRPQVLNGKESATHQSRCEEGRTKESLMNFIHWTNWM